MTALILDGKHVANELKATITQAVADRVHSGRRPPCLAVVLAGRDPASEVYVNNKRKACADVGITSKAFYFPDSVNSHALLDLINELNHDDSVDGILVQLPLPPTIDSDAIIECIAPGKDVDGFHPYNFGRLALRTPLLRPCTPYGIIQLLAAYNVMLHGKHALVIGASNIVGRPMALEFLLAGATVTIAHRFTQDLQRCVYEADIIVVATGVCDILDSRWLRKHQILIDVGIHRLNNGCLRGDVNFNEAVHQVAWITPVPGGVGPMTIATLLQNTVQAADAGERVTPNSPGG